MAESKRTDEEKDRADGSGEMVAKDIPIGDGEPEAGAQAETPEAEPDQVKTLQLKVEELENQRLMALADLDNYRKRMSRQFETVIRSANDKLLHDILDVADNFERALEHAANGDDGADDGLREGMKMIYQQVQDFLARHDVRPMETVGRRFDPNYHEALMQVASDEHAEGIVAAEINRGYMVGDRVLRHARVAVSTGMKSEDEAES